ncbi:MAG: single-stranded DNA-binding protein [bacterium]|nr:single-stranded DNA-binding protein [bacterium]MDZ4299991.1 single-stranded DNA-binding protein [Candidatus Sungbacteria bacterium]
MNLNKVFLFGNFTRDPEIRQTPGGQPVCTFGIATNRTFNDASGQKRDQVEFHNLVAWGRQAEVIAQYMKKGSSMFIEGRLQTRSWQDQQGVKHYRTEIVVDEFQFGPRPAGAIMGGGQEQGASLMRGERYNSTPSRDRNNQNQPSARADGGGQEEPPIIELPEDGEEIDVKDIPF